MDEDDRGDHENAIREEAEMMDAEAARAEHTPPTDAELWDTYWAAAAPHTNRKRGLRAVFDRGASFEAGRASVTEPKPGGDWYVLGDPNHTAHPDLTDALATARSVGEPKPDPEVVQDADDPLASIVAHSMLGAGITLTPRDVDRVRVFIETTRAEPDPEVARLSRDDLIRVLESVPYLDFGEPDVHGQADAILAAASADQPDTREVE